MQKKIALLGSTGSIGRQSIEIIRALGYSITVLSGHRNIDLLERQIAEFQPAFVAVTDPQAGGALAQRLTGLDPQPVLLKGENAARDAVAQAPADIVLNAIVGIAGLGVTLAALADGKTVALANKESLVAGGRLVLDEMAAKGGRILPVDSEHSAIFQCLQDPHSAKTLKRVILTASGGPFYSFSRAMLKKVSAQDALHHPNWDMGQKITIDSATLMNKGLEFIEAMWLFGLSANRVDVVVQRESIIHSMVEFEDHSILAQLGDPDMRLPIQYALTWPERLPSPVRELDFSRIASLSFGMPDLDTFECLAACRLAAEKGGLAPCAANCANEEAVALFLQGDIGFLDIGRLVMACVNADSYAAETYTLADVTACDQQARAFVRQHR